MKKYLREIKLTERLSHHPAEKEAKDQSICENLLTIGEIKKATYLLLYYPIHGEVDVMKCFLHFNESKKITFPRVSKNKEKLELYVVQNIDSDLEKGSFGIMEPKETLPKILPGKLDAILVPGVVFSEDGHRIGYGKGFYDRILKETKAVKIGVAYDFQIVKNGAGEHHDVPMDMIVTEKRILFPTHHSKVSIHNS